MQFHEHIAVYNSLRRSKMHKADQMLAVPWYDRQLAGAVRGDVARDLRLGTAIQRMSLERTWWVDKRPYYNVWPVAVGALTRLRLDTVDCGLIQLPLPVLLLRFAVDHEVPLYDGRKMWSVITGHVRLTDGRDGLALYIDVGERHVLYRSDDAVLCIRSFPLESGKSLEEVLRSRLEICDIRADREQEEQLFLPAIRLICTLCLLEQDPDVFEPDVLTDDRRRYEETRDLAHVARAVRKGKRGWNVGARLVASPHWRRPHFALRWTGPGGAVPRIRPVKGAVVRLRTLKEIPTGRFDDEKRDPGDEPEQPAE